MPKLDSGFPLSDTVDGDTSILPVPRRGHGLYAQADIVHGQGVHRVLHKEGGTLVQ